jgi:hypothetical protein
LLEALLKVHSINQDSICFHEQNKSEKNTQTINIADSLSELNFGKNVIANKRLNSVRPVSLCDVFHIMILNKQKQLHWYA